MLSAHREENIDTEENFYSLMNTINKIAEVYDKQILYSCHPRSKKYIKHRGFVFDRRVKQHEPLGFDDYNNLQINAFVVLSDSGGLPEEASYYSSIGFHFPAVCIRTSTERPEAMDKGNFILAGINEKQILQSINMAVLMNKNNDFGTQVQDYQDINVSIKVVKIIQSYTDIINKMVWRKL